MDSRTFPYKYILCGLALLPPLVLCWWVYRFGIRVPYWDHWDFVPILSLWVENELTLRDLARPHNAHRPMFPYIVMLVLARFTGWEVGYELLVNLLLGGCIAALWFVLFRRAAAIDRMALRPWLPLVVSIAVFSMVQWRNWLWGWQLQVFMCVAAALLALALLLQPRASKGALAGAVAAALVSTFSFGGGVAVWPAGAAGLVLMGLREPGRKRALAAWCAPFVVAGVLYVFAGSPRWPSIDKLPLSLSASYPGFFHGALGAGVFAQDGWLALAAGITGLAAMALIGFPLLRDREWARAAAPFAAVALFSMGAALLTTAVRGHEGLEGAIESRYITLTMPFWISLAALLAIAERRRPAMWRLPVVLILAAAMGLNSLHGARIGSLRDPMQADARQAIVEGEDWTILEGLHPDRRRLVRRMAELERLGLGPFQ